MSKMGEMKKGQGTAVEASLQAWKIDINPEALIDQLIITTVKLRAVDRSTFQFWNFLANCHST